MRKQAIRDGGRRVLIALLLLSALLLLRHTGYYAGFREMLQLGRGERGESTTTESAAAPRAAVSVLPIAVSVCGPEGGARYGAAYDGESTAAVFRRFSANLAEALGSADAPVKLDRAAFHAQLDGCGVFFRFDSPIPLNLLSGWLGTEMSGAAAGDSADILFLGAAETKTTLAYKTEEGAYYCCATAAKPDGLRGRAAEYAPNGAVFAWESERLADGGDDLLLQSSPQPAIVKSAVALPFGEETDQLLQSMGMNSFVTSSYSEADGTVVYVQDETTMRISPSGTVFFRHAASPDERSGELSDAVDLAWKTAEQSIGLSCGDGALFFSGASDHAAQRTCTVLLDYCVDGIPVRLASGHAAEFVLRDGVVLQARLQFRRFTRTEETAALLPYLQAAAVAGTRQATPELVYSDAGDATECMWVIANG